MNQKVHKRMHPAGFEPATFILKMDYESIAFDHLATDALELMGFEPMYIFSMANPESPKKQNFSFKK